eukprot:scpid16260/ scgid28535/ 
MDATSRSPSNQEGDKLVAATASATGTVGRVAAAYMASLPACALLQHEPTVSRPPCSRCPYGETRPGKLLDCWHKICRDCLPLAIEDDGRIKCHMCWKVTPCTPPGWGHDQLLVDDAMFDRVHRELTVKLPAPVDGEAKKPGQTQGEPQSLSPGIREYQSSYFCPLHCWRPITNYCQTCQEVLCDLCIGSSIATLPDLPLVRP